MFGEHRGPADASPSRTCSRPSAPTTPARSTPSELHGRRGPRLPGRGRLRRPVHRQHHGHRLRDARHVADGLERRPGHRSPEGRGRLRVRQAGDGAPAQGPDAARRSSPARRFENAIAGVMATGGSTNAVLHLLAIAREVGVKLAIDDFDRISRKTPVLADLKPWGNYTAPEMYEAGGMARGGASACSRRACSTRARRRSPGARSARRRRRRAETPGQKVIQPLAKPLKPDGRHRDPARQPGPRRLRGQGLRPERSTSHRGPGAGLRARGGRLRGGEGRARSSPTT